MGTFAIYHSVRRSFREKKELSRCSKMNKTLRYFRLVPSALVSETETTKMNKKTEYSNGNLERAVS